MDPVDGAYPGVVVIEGASIESVRADDDAGIGAVDRVHERPR